ncbi:MAG TPA: carbohydrate-binding protein, partial [Caldimonas sp.]|nr:carbohydrate-binding protein [Caldimonas sp.]
LAAQVSPHRAATNLRRLEHARARGRYGFIEALDYSPGRQSGAEGVARVSTFMSHHQGMSIVSIANVLLDGVARHWGMGDARIEAVASLLHERAPREVPPLREPPASLISSVQLKRSPGMFREVPPGMTAIEPTHLMSNGRYAVALRANGAGASRRGNLAITRSRDDALRDAYGWFFFVRWDRQPRPVSLTQHPAPDPAGHYHCSLHADRIAFSAIWSELEATTTVWVSPEDDIEFRQVVLHNCGERTLDLELLSSFEVTLADPRADESHPAFSNLFVSAEWQPRHQAIVLERKPRLVTDQGVVAANFLAEVEPANVAVRIQVDRQRWLGRNRDASRPLAEFDEPPDVPEGRDGATFDTGLDPVAAFAVRLQISPNAKVRLTFCTAAADDTATLRAVIDKYRQVGNIARASLMSATLTGIRLREMRITADNFAAIQTLSTALSLSLARTHLRAAEAGDVCDRRLLWRFGISGDLPIVLVSAGVEQGLGLLRSLAQALRLWSWGGVACDLVVVNHEPTSYLMPLSRAIASLKEAHAAALSAQPGCGATAFHLLQSSDLHADEMATLRALARVRLNADGRPLAHHVQELVELHERSFQERQGTSVVALGGETSPSASGAARPIGDFAPAGGEFRFDVSALSRPARPWVNVLANPHFGAQVSEAGGGYSWAMNSRLNMLTPWSNDAVADPAGEWIVLQDLRTLEAWSATPSASGDAESEYRVAHGQGYTVIGHRRGALETSVTWCVDSESAVKQVRVRLVNRGHRTLQLRLVGVAEWILGAQRSDRSSTHTHVAHVRAAPGSDDVLEGGGEPVEGKATVLFCTQRDRSAGFGGGTAFFALAGDSEEPADWTCDRRELFDARGNAVVADHFAQASGCGLDPCAVLSTRLTVRAGDSIDRVFLLGYGPSEAAALLLAEQAALVPPLRRLQRVRARWDELLGATAVRTPDPLFDALVNRWLLYQTIACRLWARAGFYQAGGAYGFRDQLQDAMALAWAAPALLRQQIVLAASRQFGEGDVQHWWHAPTGAGVRTHFSDDLLWLPHACAHYVETTGDASVLDVDVPFLEGAAIPEGAEDAYYAPAVSEETASVYEHGARAIDRSLRVGAHGLPLMGTGDWNDGMNRVGHLGRGESVWLAWFLCTVVERFAPLARNRGEHARAQRWDEARAGWIAALHSDGWDGSWFRRAFFDNGEPLGSAANPECRIDLIAQAWSVLSGASTEAFTKPALYEMERQLVDRQAGLLRLLHPPLKDSPNNPGYIQAYPRGVRENGGQYSH